MSSNNTLKVKRLAINGILTALAVITLFFASVLPTGRLSLYALSSFYVAIVVIEFGIKNGWAYYAASSILSLILVPDKIGIVPYIVFFGIYGLIKAYVERMGISLIKESILKLIYFNISIAAVFFTAKEFLLAEIHLGIPWWAVIIVLEPVFLIYDYVFTHVIRYYNGRLRKLLHF